MSEGPLLPPPQLRVRLDRAVWRSAGSEVLLGGSPPRLLRLSARARATLDMWIGGLPVGDAARDRALARRLLDAGIVHPVVAEAARHGPDDVAVVVPARNRAEMLALCLDSVGPVGEVVVVDDGSSDPSRIAAVAAAAGARVLRHPVALGPGAARNSGLRATTHPVVAFLDSDCVARRGWLPLLLAHLDDDAVAAAAPRIGGLVTGGTALARYEAVRSPLDMGREPAGVGPGRRVPFVPAAALVARRSMLGAGFDESMRVGEDVDLVWRLVEQGWTVRYEPQAEVAHQHRLHPVALLRRRFDYGTSAAALAQRHPGSVAAATVSPWSVASWGLCAARAPVAALGSVTLASALLARRLRPAPGTWRAAPALVVRGNAAAGSGLAAALRREWWPVALAAAVVSRRARPAVAAAVLAPLLGWARRRPRLDPARYLALNLADDAAYGAGVWVGCMRRRCAGPLGVRPVGSLRRHSQ